MWVFFGLKIVGWVGIHLGVRFISAGSVQFGLVKLGVDQVEIVLFTVDFEEL